LSVNSELIRLYWEIGRAIVERQRKEEWGARVIDRLATDLRRAFPGLRGFSTSSIWRMRSFYPAYSQVDTILAQAAREFRLAILQQPVGELPVIELPPVLTRIPWVHNTLLIERLKDPAERLWYAQQTLEHGWSRSLLAHQIDSGLYRRQGQAVANSARTPPAVRPRPVSSS
jgi:predicted nuclease of restriction endonuclease-like (RecB) superfamily